MKFRDAEDGGRELIVSDFDNARLRVMAGDEHVEFFADVNGVCLSRHVVADFARSILTELGETR